MDLHGDTLAIGSTQEDSNQTTITNGSGASPDNTNANSGAVYIYKRSGSNWTQQAYLKAVNNDTGDNYAYSLSLNQDTLAVSAPSEDSNQITITKAETASSDDSTSNSGAVYVYKRTNNPVLANAASAPYLDTITPPSLAESDSSTQIFDAADGGDDLDDDGDTLTYTCWFDSFQDSSVVESSSTLCNSANMSGMSFDSSTGILTWDPEDGQDGSYEFKLVVTDNNNLDTAYVDVTVNDDM